MPTNNKNKKYSIQGRWESWNDEKHSRRVIITNFHLAGFKNVVTFVG